MFENASKARKYWSHYRRCKIRRLKRFNWPYRTCLKELAVRWKCFLPSTMSEHTFTLFMCTVLVDSFQFCNRVIRVAESAVFEQKLQSQWYLADRCKSRPRESLEALHVFDFEGVFYLLFIGVAASTLGLVSELLLARTQRDPNRHNQ